VTTVISHTAAETRFVEARGIDFAGLIPDAQIRIYPDAARGRSLSSSSRPTSVAPWGAVGLAVNRVHVHST
jgi:hypothetical protein